MSHGHDEVDTGPAERTHGLLAEFSTPDALLEASRKCRDAGFSKWDACTPYPIHGLEGAMGIKMTRLPWVVFFMGLTGFTTATLLQIGANGAFGYAFHISGKPLAGWPSMGPVMFELTVLFSALTTLLVMAVFNNLPLFNHPAFKVENFKHVTSHSFFVIIEARDPKFTEAGTAEFLKSLGAEKITTLTEPTKVEIPKIIKYVAIVATCAALIPPAIIFRARNTHSENVKIHLVDDMDFQPKFRAQQTTTFFADKSADRLAIPGTIAQGELNLDDHLIKGTVGGKFINGFPAALKIDDEAMKRGQKMFNIYCTACHGLAGNGDGMVHQRAVDIQESNWVPPTNLAGETTLKLTDGEIFNAISNGIRNMQPYGGQIVPEDRWKIVLYLRALQKAQPLPAKTAEQVDELKGKKVGAN